MKKTLIAIAAAATVSLGAIGAASAASTATSTAFDMSVKTGVSTQEVGYHYNRFYGNYGYGYQYCKHLYYKGWVLDYRWAQIKYLRHCRYKYNY